MSGPSKCPVCGEVARSSFTGALYIRCPLCGDYAVSVGVQLDGEQLAVEPETDRFKLICVLAERHLKGKTGLFITGSRQENPLDGRELATIEELIAEFPREPTEFFDRALLNLSRLTKYPTDGIRLPGNVARLLFSLQTEETMLAQLEEIGYIRKFTGMGTSYLITGKGWERIEKLNAPGKESRQAFVAMWFDPSQDLVFAQAIRPAIEEAGFRPLKIDLKEHNRKIDDEIVAEIRRSRFLVADFSGNRGGVYFESGFALGLGLPVIWCIQESDLADVHFDTRQYNFIVYATPADLRGRLLNRIRATIV